MSDFVRCVGIEDLVGEAGGDPLANFEATYSRIHREGNRNLLEKFDKRIRSYFATIELPSGVTVYDKLILSLRPKDVIVTFNWDPLLPQAYRRWRHLGDVLPELVFLHGNVELGTDMENKVCGFMFDEPYPGRNLTASKLLYPVEQKDYNTDPFVADQWKHATDFLKHAYFVTIFGYSAPVTDVEARSLLLQAWRDNPTRELAEISIVDIRPEAEVEKSWSDFIVRTHGGASNDISHNILMRHPRRSCEAFAFATLQQQPWSEDSYPECVSLVDLESWIRPLIEEEKTGKLAGKPHHPKR